MQSINRTTIQSPRLPCLLLGFWTAWYSVVVASNAGDGLKALGWLPASWPFASGNLALVRQTTAIYGLPETVVVALFAAAVLWEFAAAVAFGLALRRQSVAAAAWPAIERAFLVGLGLWAAFILADEIFIAYPTGIEGSHLRIFVAHLASLVAVSLLVRREA